MMMPRRWSNVLRRVTAGGPYVNERMSIVVLSSVVMAGVAGVAYADQFMAPLSLAPLYLLPLALSALVNPLRISIALSIVCLALHDFLSPPKSAVVPHLTRDATKPS